MSSLELKIPPVIVFLVAALGLYFTPIVGTYSMILGSYIKVISIAVLFIAIFIGVLGVITFKKAKTTVHPVNITKTSSLVTNGIFSYSRNPMYLAMALVIVSMSIHTNNVLSLLWVLPYCAFITQFQIKPEEKMLLSLFNQDYVQYMSSVRRWL